MEEGIFVRPYKLNPVMGSKYFAYISKGYRNSQPVPYLFSGHEPIIISSELPGVKPDNFFYIARAREDDKERGSKLSYEEFYSAILASEQIQSLFMGLAERQGSLKIKTFRNHGSYSGQFETGKIECFGLTPAQSEELNNKARQFRMLDGIVPLPRYRICKAGDKGSVLAAYNEVNKAGETFLARAYGGGGSGSFIVRGEQDLEKTVQGLEDDEEIIIAEKLDICANPSIDVIAANPEEIIVYGLMDQIFDQDSPLSCRGNAYPSSLSRRDADDATEMAAAIGKAVAETGISGHFSIDFNLSERGLTFGEINARYTGNTAERMLLYELSKPPGHPSLMDLEAMAIGRRTFGRYRELWTPPERIGIYKKELNAPWHGTATEVFKVNDERELFRHGGTSSIGWPETGARIFPSDPIGKIVSVGKDREESEREAELLAEIILSHLNERFVSWNCKESHN